VPHAGLVYSGIVAAAAWRHITPDPPPSIVLLGTNHRAAWLDGVGAWEAGAWSTPLGPIEVDEALAVEILGLGPPFAVDRAAHLGEHSIEVQLPFVRRLAPLARITPLAVSLGTGARAVEAGARLGELLAQRRRAGDLALLAIRSDAAHYPPAWLGEDVNARLAPAIEGVDPAGAAATEAAIVAEGGPGLVCGMCGIEPTVLGLAALRAMGVTRGRIVSAATSADVGAGRDRTVGYLGATFAL
jgi:AmmeMemoRadiSam system protein B